MPNEQVSRFITLIEHNSPDPISFDRIICDLSRRGSRREAIICSRQLRRRKLETKYSIKSEIINLLCLGKNAQARSLLAAYGEDLRLTPSFKWMADRYLSRKSLKEEAARTLSVTRQALLAEISLNKKRSRYLHKLFNFSDYIIISNSSQLRFSNVEKGLFRQMEKPLFVYQNIANPSILPARGEFYNSQAHEVVIGGFKNLYTASGELFFKPWSEPQFIGSLTRVNPPFRSLWVNSLSAPIRRINYPHSIEELDESLLIDSLYPLTLFSTGVLNQRRICTIGWITLCLFDAIAHASGQNAKLWSAGFNMSASYVFESCDSLYFHDYPFEKVGLELRVANGSLISVGSTLLSTPEATTADHLEEAGIKREKIVDFKKRTGHWPVL